MNMLTEHLLDILDDLNRKNEAIYKVASIILRDAGGFSLLESVIGEVEIAIIESLGGTKKQWLYLLENIQEIDSFEAYFNEVISKDDLVNQLKITIASDLKLN